MMATLLSFIIVIGILIFVHELGHFLVAKRKGVTVEKFSLGFGPKLIGFNKGGTQYMLSAIPLGGYVKLKGENPDEPLSNDQGEFGSRSVGVRAAIVAAGPLMNFLLSFMLMPLVFLIGIQVPSYLNEKPVVQWVAKGSPAEAAGLRKGDSIIAVDGEDVENWKMFNALTQVNPNKSIRVRFIRAGLPEEKTVAAGSPNEVSGGVGIFHHMPPRLAGLVPDSPAQRAGLQQDDIIENIAGIPISHWIQLSEVIRDFPGEDVSLTINRKGEPLSLTLRPDTVIEEVESKSPADGARLQVGDRIESINGTSPSLFKEALLSKNFPAQDKLDFEITRAGERTVVTADTQGKHDIGIGVSGKIGIVPAEEVTFKRYGILASIREGFLQAWEMTKLTVWALGKLLSLQVSLKTLGGPIMIAKMTGTAAKSGIASLIIFTAFLSINLSILNLLPVPVLDGGHLLFFLIEFIIRRPLGMKKMEIAQKVGLALLIMLLLTVTYNDILRSLPQKYLDFLPWK